MMIGACESGRTHNSSDLSQNFQVFLNFLKCLVAVNNIIVNDIF